MKTRLITILVAGCISASNLALGATLQIDIKGIKKLEGHLMVLLCKGKSSYDSGNSPLSSKLKVASSEETAIFENIDAGEYAVKLFHDKNDNGEMDTNFVGLPKEGYGFSNNVGRFGPAKYEDARFEVAGDTVIDITLR